jgi:hypothetical protein
MMAAVHGLKSRTKHCNKYSPVVGKTLLLYTEKFRYYVPRYCVQIVIKYRFWIPFLLMYLYLYESCILTMRRKYYVLTF